MKSRHTLGTNGSFCVLPAVGYRSSWKFIRWSLPPRFSIPCAYLCVPCMFMACVCVCVFFFSFSYCIQYCWYLCTLAAVRRNCISVNCRGLFVWNQKKKVSKMRSFYENVKWRHFRPSAIKDWRHPCCHSYILFLFLYVIVVVLHNAF